MHAVGLKREVLVGVQTRSQTCVAWDRGPLLPSLLPNPDDEERQVAYVTEKRGVFYAVIYEGRNPVSGRERRRWHRCDDRREAEAVADDLTERRARQRHSGSSLTVAEYLLGRWLPAKETTLAPTTCARYVTSVEHYLLPHLGDTPLRRLRTEHLETLYRRLLLVGGRRGGPLAAKTITNLHQIVRSSLNDAVERGLLPSNPATPAHVPDPRKRPSGRRRARSWTASELGDFLTGTATNPYSMLFRLAAATGMRRGEVLGLRWDGVHFDTGRIEVTQALTSIGYRLEFSRLKTRTSRRNITVDAHTMTLLARWRQDQTVELAAAGVTNAHGLVFVRPDGQPLHPHSVSQAFERPSVTSRCRRSGSTTCATPMPASCCVTGSRSRLFPNASGTPTRHSR
jgi:integrase